MTDLYLFTYGTLYYPEQGPRPRQRTAVDRWFTALANGQTEGRAAVLWPCYEVGQRYTLKQAGIDDSRLANLPHEAQAEENAARLAQALGVYPAWVYLCFNWFNYVDKRAEPGPGLIPEARAADPRWSAAWRFPEPGMITAALQAAGVGPGAALLVYEYSNEKAAADQLFVPTCYGPQFFLTYPRHGQYVKQRRVTRRPLDEFMGNE